MGAIYKCEQFVALGCKVAIIRAPNAFAGAFCICGGYGHMTSPCRTSPPTREHENVVTASPHGPAVQQEQ